MPSTYQIQCPKCGTKITIKDGYADCPKCDYRAKVVGLPGQRSAIARCIREQRRCLQYLRNHGFTAPPGERAIDGGTAGAWMGLCDWLMEESLLRQAIG